MKNEDQLQKLLRQMMRDLEALDMRFKALRGSVALLASEVRETGVEEEIGKIEVMERDIESMMFKGISQEARDLLFPSEMPAEEESESGDA